MAEEQSEIKPIYKQIYAIVEQIPAGCVATYGQIAHIVGCNTPRMVGYAMAGLPPGSDVPWHRVINAAGKISPRGNALSTDVQRQRLEDEGVAFTKAGNVNLSKFRWGGPPWAWLVENGIDPEN